MSSGPRDTQWTAEHDAELTSLLPGDKTYTQIGAVLNRSRNAIAGRARRLNLPPKPRELPKAPPAAVTKAPVAKRTVHHIAHRPKRPVELSKAQLRAMLAEACANTAQQNAP